MLHWSIPFLRRYPGLSLFAHPEGVASVACRSGPRLSAVVEGARCAGALRHTRRARILRSCTAAQPSGRDRRLLLASESRGPRRRVSFRIARASFGDWSWHCNRHQAARRPGPRVRDSRRWRAERGIDLGSLPAGGRTASGQSDCSGGSEPVPGQPANRTAGAARAARCQVRRIRLGGRDRRRPLVSRSRPCAGPVAFRNRTTERAHRADGSRQGAAEHPGARGSLVRQLLGNRSRPAARRAPRRRRQRARVRPAGGPMTRYEEALAALAARDPDLVVLTAENRAAIRTLPAILGDRFIDVGICEQTLIGAAAGLALRGRKPIVHALATFLTMRAFEFIRTDIGLPALPVILVGAVPGFLSEANGPTHQALEDVALMRAIPGMNVFCPADEAELVEALPLLLAGGRPCYIRYNAAPPALLHSSSFEVGKAELLGRGRDVAILTYGTLVREALVAGKLL